MMKVLFENQIFSGQRFGGISRYFVELIKHLDPDIVARMPICLSPNEYLRVEKVVNYNRKWSAKNFRGKGILTRLFNKLIFIFYRKSNFDVVHTTYYDPYFVKSIGGKPLVVTVHDMIHEIYPEQFGPSDRTSRNKRVVCERANKIIAISENTKRDLIKFFGIAEQKIEVIYHGHSFDQFAKTQQIKTMELPSRYVLFTGARGGYKNFERFVEAFSLVDSQLELICTGSPFSAKERELLAQLGLEARCRALFVDDRQLAELYSGALLFVFPSLYEGFGIPILEAFASGCPIALSDASSFPEIAGDAGVYFDPLSVDSIFQAMQKIICDEKFRSQMIEKGKSQVALFSCEKMAHQTSTLYRNVKNDKPLSD